MFVPEPMRRVSILTLGEDLERVSREIGELGVLHLFDVSELGDWAARLKWPHAESLARGYGSLQRRLDAVMTTLGLPLTVDGGDPPPIAPEKALAQSAEWLQSLEVPVNALVERRKRVFDDAARLKVIAQELELLTPLNAPLGELRRLQFLYLAMGLVPRQNLERLRGSLAGIPNLILTVRTYGDRLLIFAFAARDDTEIIERALRAAYLEKTELPERFDGTPREAMEELAAQRDELDEEDAHIEAEIRALAEGHRSELLRLKAAVAANREVVDAWVNLGKTERTFLFTGWVPAATEKALIGRVEKASENRAVVDVAEPGRPGENEDERPPVPTALHNPPLVRPFEGLVETYGLPSYWEVDPTPLAGVLFLVMFGVMFGDLGQGAVVALAGVLLARGLVARSLRSLGPVLIGAGLSSMVFGLLYGSVFGSEDVITALLFHPIRNVTFFIEVAVAFGGLVVTAGMVLNILSAIRARDFHRLIWSEYGVVGLLLYWGLGALVLMLMLGRGITPILAAVLLGIPAALLYLREPLAALLRRGGERTKLPPEGGATYFVEAAIEVFDVIIRFVSNTLSFLRLAAFALSHAGLGIMVFTLAAMVSSLPLASPLVIVLGNLLIVSLEALIVGIQTLRLEYYEFFTKFFGGRGVPYAPFAIPIGRNVPDQERAIPGLPHVKHNGLD